jgi:hypothetical protein
MEGEKSIMSSGVMLHDWTWVESIGNFLNDNLVPFEGGVSLVGQ